MEKIKTQIAPHKPLVMVKRILAPTDFSPGAEEATEWAMALGAPFGAEVTLLHVLDLSVAAAAGLPTQVAAMPALGALMEQLRSEGKTEIGKLAARFPSAKNNSAGEHTALDDSRSRRGDRSRPDRDGHARPDWAARLSAASPSM